MLPGSTDGRHMPMARAHDVLARLDTRLSLAAVLAAVGVAAPIALGRAASPSPSRGKILFVAACGSCHTLAAAGTSGRKGPNLDDEAPSYGDLVDQITQGGEGMPAFAKALRAAQIRAIATFVSRETSGSRGGGDD
ncbi:MAG TPA: cytochrome c [Gaiellaceae bacterium]|nr:cytochrome c [Gaiellaceae bacterium]